MQRRLSHLHDGAMCHEVGYLMLTLHCSVGGVGLARDAENTLPCSATWIHALGWVLHQLLDRDVAGAVVHDACCKGCVAAHSTMHCILRQLHALNLLISLIERIDWSRWLMRLIEQLRCRWWLIKLIDQKIIHRPMHCMLCQLHALDLSNVIDWLSMLSEQVDWSSWSIVLNDEPGAADRQVKCLFSAQLLPTYAPRQAQSITRIPEDTC